MSGQKLEQSCKDILKVVGKYAALEIRNILKSISACALMSFMSWRNQVLSSILLSSFQSRWQNVFHFTIPEGVGENPEMYVLKLEQINT